MKPFKINVMKKIRVFAMAVFTLMFLTSEAQILGGILNEAQRKLERKIEQKVIDAVAEELAARAFRPIASSIDSLLKSEYEMTEKSGNKIDYTEFLESLNKKVDLPEQYTFDLIQDVETTDYDGKKSNVKLYYAKNDAIFAIEDLSDSKNKQIVVIDIDRDAMIMYSENKKGEKSAQVVPSVMKITKSIVNSSINDTESTEQEYTFKKTGKTKKIAGYKAEEYIGSTQEEDVKFYMATDFPVYTQNAMQAYMNNIVPAAYQENSAHIKDIKAVMLEYENKRKDAKGKKTTWITKNVTEKSFNLVNKDYGLEEVKE